MKKSVLVAAALATLAVSGNAMALTTGVERDILVDAFIGGGCGGCGAFLTLGKITFTALGVAGHNCDYLGDWESPWNPNDVGLCLVHELRTAFSPSCIVNERQDITTVVSAGPGTDACFCQGFNLKGEGFENVTLMVAEGLVGLQGIVVIPSVGMPQVYPVRIL
jgi:hypothetical protein